MMDRMYDLSWEIAGDTIQLEQDAGCGEVSRVDLHACQLRLLAERAGLLSPAPAVAWPRGFLRRVERFHLRLADLVDFLASIRSYPPQSEMDEDEARARDLLNDLDDLLTDYGILPDNGENAGEAPRAEPCAGQTSEAPGQQSLC